MKYTLLFITLLGTMLAATPVRAEEMPQGEQPVDEQTGVLRFAITRYQVDGATLISPADIKQTVAPYIGDSKDFSDVQRALEAIEELYAERGFSAVRVLLPEQELEHGLVRFRVVESRFGQVTVKDNRFVTASNALNALPSVRSGGIPRSKQIARELKFANENPARQMNVVLKAGDRDDQVDANIIVTDRDPVTWGISADNTGTPETGPSRLSLSWRHANLFDNDHVANMQIMMSPERPNRLTVLGGGYKIPLYSEGDSVELFGGYSNVNSVVGGLNNFQGGGLIFSARYNHPLERIGVFDPRLSFGADWRDFRRVEMSGVPPTVLYKEIVVAPLSISYIAQGKFDRSDVGFNLAASANLPGVSKGSANDFANYDQVYFTRPNPDYKIIRYGANYAQAIGDDWQFRAALTGQWTRDVLVQGEQIRLGGVDGVRGFSEGSVGGEVGMRWNLEGYTPELGSGEQSIRALIFLDGGKRKNNTDGTGISIASSGFGLRASFDEQVSLRFDAGRILNAGDDPLQKVGDWRTHLGMSASF